MTAINIFKPFSSSVLEAIVKIQREVHSLEGEGAIDTSLTQFLRDKGYIDIVSSKTVILSEEGMKLYESLISLVSQNIGVSYKQTQ
jgi:hypothetical protein